MTILVLNTEGKVAILLIVVTFIIMVFSWIIDYIKDSNIERSNTPVYGKYNIRHEYHGGGVYYHYPQQLHEDGEYHDMIYFKGSAGSFGSYDINECVTFINEHHKKATKYEGTAIDFTKPVSDIDWDSAMEFGEEEKSLEIK